MNRNSPSPIATGLLPACVAFALLVGVPALALLHAPTALAAPPVTAFQLERFEPNYAPDLNLMSVATSDVLGHFAPSFALTTHVSAGALRVEGDAGTGAGWQNWSSVDYSTRLEISAALGIARWLDVGIVVPVTVYQDGSVLSGAVDHRPVDGAALQDPRLTVKFRPLRPEWAGGLGLAVALTTYVPAGSTSRLGSSGSTRIEPRFIIDWRHEVGVKIAANVAFEASTDESTAVLTPHWLKWGVGLAVPLGVEGLQVVSTVFGQSGFGQAQAASYDGIATGAIEFDGEVRYSHASSGLFVSAGGGTGLTHAVGSPRWRGMFTIGWSSDYADTDQDGVPNHTDLCEDLAEDIDGFQDEDGCPDDDNDDDRVPDDLDRCPLAAEDVDGFEDEDGCPDSDNDGDGIPDTEDKCPLVAEDRDGSQDADGCPEADDDGDGIPDAVDQCAHNKEDRDGFEDHDGCLDPDNDKDGIFDLVDLCPDEAETANGVADSDGCPDGERDLAAITRRSVWLRSPVEFQRGTAQLTSDGRKVLREAAVLLIRHAAVGDILVEGHTDDSGDEAELLYLSQERAEAARAYLIEVGVAEQRLEARGFGGTLPMDTNETAAGRRANNRIELRFAKPHGSTAGHGEAP